jgi:hypothetical protein
MAKKSKLKPSVAICHLLLLKALEITYPRLKSLCAFFKVNVNVELFVVKANCQVSPRCSLSPKTDNGLEFTDRFVTKSKQVNSNHQFDKLCSLSEIEHRTLCHYHR